jgi:hypothetical protein
VLPLSQSFEYFDLLTYSLSEAFSEPLKVIVGKEKIAFYIFKSLICAESDFFKAACHEHWESGRSNTVTLEDDDPDIFSVFMTWLVTQDIKRSSNLMELDAIKDSSEAGGQILQLAKCYVLGDVLRAHNFQNSIMDNLNAICEKFYNEFDRVGAFHSEISYIYSKTSEGCSLRRLMVDSFVDGIDPCTMDVTKCLCLKDGISRVPGLFEYYFEICKRSLTILHDDEPYVRVLAWEKDPCVYHLHPNKAEGYSCTRQL